MTNKKTHSVYAIVDFGVEMDDIEADSKEHAIEIFKRDWRWKLLDPEFEINDQARPVGIKIEWAVENEEESE
tara:strand:- start:318 stop:533 length:216 start_codon:yes stop_codon:yes gene_type:complete